MDEAGARNAATFSVSGFSYLRTNRFLTGLKQDLDTEARKERWIRWLQQLDSETRKKEIRKCKDFKVLLSGHDNENIRIIRFRYTGGAARYGQHEMGEI